MGLDLKIVSLWAEGPFNHALENMDDFQMDVAYRGYAAAQLLTFEKYLGWFFLELQNRDCACLVFS